MRKRLDSYVVAVCTLLMGITALLYALSYLAPTNVGWESRVYGEQSMYQEWVGVFALRGSIGFGTGELGAEMTPAVMASNPPARTGFYSRLNAEPWPREWSRSTWNRLGFVFDRVDIEGYAFRWWNVAVPGWLPLTITGIVPTARARSIALSRARAARVRKGLCAECGYDVRASTDRCPECGSRIGPVDQRAPLLAS